MFPGTILFFAVSLKDFTLMKPVQWDIMVEAISFSYSLKSFLRAFCHGYRHKEPIWAAVHKQRPEQISLLESPETSSQI